MLYKIQLGVGENSQIIEVNEDTFEAICKEHDKFYNFKFHKSLDQMKKMHDSSGYICFQFPETIELIKQVVYKKPVDDIINNL